MFRNSRQIFDSFREMLTKKYETDSLVAHFFDAPRLSILDDMIAKINFNPYKVTYGSCKIVFIHKKENYVIKIPFHGIENYCQNEARFFVRAKEQGIEQMFAFTEFLGTIILGLSNIDVILQEKASTIKPNEKTKSYRKFSEKREFTKEEEQIHNILRPWYEFAVNEEDYNPLTEHDSFIAYCFYLDYGFENFNKLTDFLISNIIDDIHDENIGFNENGKIILIDFAGV